MTVAAPETRNSRVERDVRRKAPGMRLLLGLWILAALVPLLGLAQGSAEDSSTARVSKEDGENLCPTEVRTPFVGLPREELFRPLLGDPKEPRTFATYLHSSSHERSTHVGAVGFGERWGIVRRQGQREGDGWQLGLSGGVFAQFDMSTESTDLVNADYLIGFPLTWRRGEWSGRFNFYHQSSHLGDEFLLNTNAERINLSFEAVEVLVARDLGSWRVYGGGEYLVDPEPSDLAARGKSPVGLTRGSCEVRSRREEEAMRCHRRRRTTQSGAATPSCPRGYGGLGPSSAPTLRSDGKASICHVGTKSEPKALVIRLTRLLPRAASPGSASRWG